MDSFPDQNLVTNVDMMVDSVCDMGCLIRDTARAISRRSVVINIVLLDDSPLITVYAKVAGRWVFAKNIDPI